MTAQLDDSTLAVAAVAITIPAGTGTFSSPGTCTTTGPDCGFTMRADTAVHVTGS